MVDCLHKRVFVCLSIYLYYYYDYTTLAYWCLVVALYTSWREHWGMRSAMESLGSFHATVTCVSLIRSSLDVVCNID